MKRSNHKKRNILLLVLLAVFCIGTAELAACRYFAPEQFQQIVAPLGRACSAAAGFFRARVEYAADSYHAALDSAAQFWEDLTARESGPEEGGQLASDPVVSYKTPAADPMITELASDGERDILTGGLIEIVYFNQGDEAWAGQPYGSDNIGSYGCGPTAMAMAVASLTGEETDPAAMAQWAVEHGYWARKSGSYLSIVEGTARAYGIHVESVSPQTPDELVDILISGKIMVALMGPGHFTQGGHFILLRGVTLSGQILVADPNSVERSLTVWDPQLLLDELSVKTTDGAPLWALSKEEAGIF